ncbi:hypothetical protein [Hydrogenovibrio kuenenii]|uniref:hypothetical protein n=1 Tax=Hydrogenovibrio kuenenii TaxID=63658 RepID=UPI0004653F9F|nr:hypothetical protein [Hydrogenovibrio kuenenii]
MASSALTLWIPNLLAPENIAETDVGAESLSCPALETLLAKADKLPKDNRHKDSIASNASYLFHQKNTLPVAPTTAVFDLENFDASYFWLRVDPVQMIPDRDTLVLIPGESLGIGEDEARALVDAFNQHFAQDRVELEMGDTLRWYIRILQPIDVQTHSLETMSYYSIQDAMPQGNASAYWRQLMNEVQMLFFTHPVNEARRSNGLPEINGVWVWGEGQYKADDVYVRQDAALAGNLAYLKGLAKLSQSSFFEAPESYPAWQILMVDTGCNEQMVVLDDALSEMTEEEWLVLLQRMEKDWFAPMLEQLKSGQIHSLLLDLGMSHRYYLTPKHLKKFWRWKKPLSMYTV